MGRRLLMFTMPLVLLGAAAAVAAVALRGGESNTAALTPPSDAQRAVDTLCDVKRTAATDPGRGQAKFHSQAHPALSGLSTSLQATDRPGSARLLEAINAVTATFQSNAMSADFSNRIDALIELTRTDYAAHGQTTTGCTP